MKHTNQYQVTKEGSPRQLPTHRWRGGVPGFERSWNHPGNWIEGTLPGWRSHVLIDGDCRFAPVIGQPCDDITSLQLTTGATLTLGVYGELTIDGLFDPQRSGLINAGHVRNYGEIFLRNCGLYGLRNAGFVLNAGTFFFDELRLEKQVLVDPRFENQGELIDLSC